MSAHVQSVKVCGKMKTSNSKKDGLVAIHVIDGTILGVLDFVECHQNELHLSADIVDKSVITTDSMNDSMNHSNNHTIPQYDLSFQLLYHYSVYYNYNYYYYCYYYYCSCC